MYVKGVFLDFSSAFKTFNPCILIDKLYERAMTPNIINWTFSYLTART